MLQSRVEAGYPATGLGYPTGTGQGTQRLPNAYPLGRVGVTGTVPRQPPPYMCIWVPRQKHICDFICDR